MSRDIVDKPASQLLFVLGCRFLLFCALGWVSLFPVGPLIVTGCVDVVLGDYFAGFGSELISPSLAKMRRIVDVDGLRLPSLSK